MNNNSKLILGTVQFGLKYGVNNSAGMISNNDVDAILNYAKSMGIDTLDTAAAYGDAEEKIGNFHANNESFNIITKFDKLTGADWEESIKASLDKLKIPMAEAAMFHSFGEYFKYKDDLTHIIQSGIDRYFRYIGVSVYTNQELVELMDDERVKIIQVPFNLLDNEGIKGNILLRLKEKGKIIHVRSVFLQGLFYKPLNELPKKLSALEPHLAILQEICRENDIDMNVLALHYTHSKRYIDRVIIGIDNEEQLKRNLRAINQQISPDLISEIDAIKVDNPVLLNPSAW